MAKYKVRAYYRKWEREELVVDDSTMCTCADLDAAKRVFLSKYSQITERVCAALNYTTLMCGVYVESEDGNSRPLSCCVDLSCEDDE